jgi:four helix bundle protein
MWNVEVLPAFRRILVNRIEQVALLGLMRDSPRNRTPENLANRTRRFAVAIVRFYVNLPKANVHAVLGKQLLRCGTSAGAQYREARRAKSSADFISKMEGALQELDEATYWLEVLDDAGLAAGKENHMLAAEANELIAIFVTLIKRARETPARAA